MKAQKKKEIVYLRKRPRKNGTFALYLDICRDGKRTNEYLKLYLVPEKTREDKQKNKETLKFAEAIRAKRIVEMQSKDFGIDVATHEDAMFLDVMRKIIDRKDGTTKTSWQNCLAHVLKYEPNERITFAEITPQWVRGFRDYLDTKAMQWAIDTRKRDVEPKRISQGTKALMFQKFCSVFNIAMREGMIRLNPTIGVERFKEPESDREFLTIDEIRKLSKTPPPDKDLAQAFFFSCLTGLRWSDIVKLKWLEVQEWHAGRRIVFTQQKTGGLEYLDLNTQAASMLGERGNPDDLVFPKLGPIQSARISIAAWVKSAGIDKHITFHCARHTFAVMMLDLGVDLYTVSKLLGHKSIETTQVYAKILDKNKKAAVERIPTIFGNAE
ncbi:site-specific integrase [Bacteroides caecimuris]|uniref:site-specific integrase n=1 Tax=Bacteroides caecimuris TaxID=1796613 RepID=UPI002572612F|nr:site-specific integrase [Bacteroides caecimuris]MCX4295009.1 site-specific integrase [Prevotella sp.]